MQRAASGATSLGRAATHAAAEVLQQDEHSAEWRAQRKHFFVLSNAGAPIDTTVPCVLWEESLHYLSRAGSTSSVVRRSTGIALISRHQHLLGTLP